MIDAHLPALPEHRQQEQRGGDAHPEQQVQQKGQPAQTQAVADGPQQIVKQAQRTAQQHSLAEHRRLAQHVHMHGQRSSREKNPPRVPPSSS